MIACACHWSSDVSPCGWIAALAVWVIILALFWAIFLINKHRA